MRPDKEKNLCPTVGDRGQRFLRRHTDANRCRQVRHAAGHRPFSLLFPNTPYKPIKNNWYKRKCQASERYVSERSGNHILSLTSNIAMLIFKINFDKFVKSHFASNLNNYGTVCSR